MRFEPTALGHRRLTNELSYWSFFFWLYPHFKWNGRCQLHSFTAPCLRHLFNSIISVSSVKQSFHLLVGIPVFRLPNLQHASSFSARIRALLSRWHPIHLSCVALTFLFSHRDHTMEMACLPFSIGRRGLGPCDQRRW